MPGRASFLYKLFVVFLITGVIPLALLSAFFGLFSSEIIKKSYSQQSESTLGTLVGEMDTYLEEMNAAVNSLCVNDEIVSTLTGRKDPGKSTKLILYQVLYGSISGHLDNAAVHIISLTGFPSFSTQKVPSLYINAPSDILNELFARAERNPDRIEVSLNNYINDRGAHVSLTLCRAITDRDGTASGFVVMDIYKRCLAVEADRINRGVFSELMLVDPERNLVSDLYHPENDGNFSMLPFLTKVEPRKKGLFIQDERMVAFMPLSSASISAAGSVPLNVVLINLAYLVRVTLWLLLFCLLLAVVLAVLISRSLSSPIHRLSESMGRVEAGDLSVRMDDRRKDEIGLLFHRFNVMTARIETLMKETLEEQKQLMIAERKALLSQINPHFLYNTLNTIKSTAKLEGIDSIVTIVTQLGKLMRATIENDEEFVTLGDSLDLVESYLAIQRIRYGDKIQTEIVVPETLRDNIIPKLIIQPIVENGIIHGLEPKLGPGKIRVEAAGDNQGITITVEDDGAGLDNQWIAGRDDENTGIGLQNIDRRLRLYYGADYGLTVKNNPESGVSVTLRIPVNGERKNG